MELRFPLLGGGIAEGISDAGIETFEGDFATNIVRECTQNSLDATHDHKKPVVMTIDWLRLPTGELPFIPRLREAVTASRSYWHTDPKAQEFFGAAGKALENSQVEFLKVSDSNTTGLDGSDDELGSRWVGLVKSRYASAMKDIDSGGNFGIGKDAALAGSLVRTALYSTRTIAGDVAFQGVSRLVTHRDGDGNETQASGFIGRYEPQGPRFVALRSEAEIPNRFLRTIPGLDIWLVACRLPTGDTWQQPFIRSALANFWPAIAQRKVKFVIGGFEVDHTNLAELMEREKHAEIVGEEYPYFRSYNEPSSLEFSEKLPHAGVCRLHLLFGEKDLPRKICMVRRTGMVIEPYAPRVGFVPFAGLFVCEDKVGNQLLKSLEPPSHNKFDINRAKTEAARAALLAIREWIRKTIKEQSPNKGADSFNLSDVPPELLEREDDIQPPAPDKKAEEQDLGGKPAEPLKSTPIGTISSVTRLGSKSTGTSDEEPGGTGEGIPGRGRRTGLRGTRKRKRTGRGTRKVSCLRRNDLMD
jgi:hypothetical protein